MKVIRCQDAVYVWLHLQRPTCKYTIMCCLQLQARPERKAAGDLLIGSPPLPRHARGAGGGGGVPSGTCAICLCGQPCHSCRYKLTIDLTGQVELKQISNATLTCSFRSA